MEKKGTALNHGLVSRGRAGFKNLCTGRCLGEKRRKEGGRFEKNAVRKMRRALDEIKKKEKRGKN